MSGHSRWSTIKRTKGAADAKRGQLWTKLIKEITVAARLGGGDQNANSRLRRAVLDGRGNNMPADNITRAIKKGTGELEGINYEEITYEGVGPSGALFMIECLTDNRNRTNPELRKIFERNNGQQSVNGTAGWAFDQKGVIAVDREGVSEEQVFEAAVGAGAEDVEDAGDVWLVKCEKAALETVRSAVEEAKLKVKSAGLAMVPKTKKIVSGRDAQVLVNLAQQLEDHDDVQKVYYDFELSEEALEELSKS